MFETATVFLKSEVAKEIVHKPSSKLGQDFIDLGFYNSSTVKRIESTVLKKRNPTMHSKRPYAK